MAYRQFLVFNTVTGFTTHFMALTLAIGLCSLAIFASAQHVAPITAAVFVMIQLSMVIAAYALNNTLKWLCARQQCQMQ